MPSACWYNADDQGYSARKGVWRNNDEEDFCARLAFCLFCEGLFSSLIRTEGAETIDEIARLASIISEEIEYSDENTLSLMV